MFSATVNTIQNPNSNEFAALKSGVCVNKGTSCNPNVKCSAAAANGNCTIM
jgi:hypothetical protein